MLPPQAPPGILGLSLSEWRQLNARLYWAYAHEVVPRFLRSRAYSYNRAVAWLIKHGKVSVDVNGRISTAQKGQWIFLGTKDGEVTFLPGSIILSINFCAHWETGTPLINHVGAIVLEAVAEPELTRAAEELQSVVARISNEESPFRFSETITTADGHFAIQRAFHQWLCAYIDTMVRCGQEPSSMALADRRVIQAIRLIEGDVQRFAISEAELARMVGIGVRYLNRLFVREIGLTPKQYIDRRRLQEAVFLLEYHGLSVKEVAYKLGFGSLSHFSVWFGRHKHTTPREYKKTHSR